jgi:hypothetical protein
MFNFKNKAKFKTSVECWVLWVRCKLTTCGWSLKLRFNAQA